MLNDHMALALGLRLTVERRNMPKRRDDILQRARELTEKYTDRELLAEQAMDSEERLDILSRICVIENTLRREFGVERSTAISQLGVIIRERRRKYR